MSVASPETDYVMKNVRAELNGFGMNEESNEKQREEGVLDDDICIHIFTASATLVGVCLTVIGLFRVVTKLKDLNSIADNILAVDALAFLISCFLSYIALRTRSKRRHNLERLADAVFLMALCLIAVVCVLIAYEFV